MQSNKYINKELGKRDMPFKRRRFLTLVGLSGFGIGSLHSQAQSQCLSTSKRSDQAFQHTKPSTKPLLQFIAVGDAGTGQRSQSEVAKSMMRYRQTHPFPLVLLAGDNIYEGGKIHKVKSVFEQPYKDLLQEGVKFHAVLGNHDIRSNQGKAQIQYPGFNMQGRYYTFSHAPVQFFALDTNPGQHWPTQLKWLEAALAQSQAPWKIVIGHHNIYSSGFHSFIQRLVNKIGTLREKIKVYPFLADHLTPLFAKYDVQLYINGHEHHYERTLPINGTTYLTCGTGGAQLRPTKRSSWTAFSTSQFGFAAFDVFEDRIMIKGIGVDCNSFDRGTVARQLFPQSNRKI